MIKMLPNQSSLPATRALQMLEGDMPAREYRRTVSPDSSGSSLSSMGDVACSREAFDMDDLLRATQPVEDSIAFPVIEWCRDDYDDEADVQPDSIKKYVKRAQHHEESSPGKRRRSGLAPHMSRCKSRKTHLCSLASTNSIGPATAALEEKLQFGSWGQFVPEDDTPTFSIGSNNTRNQTPRRRSSKSPMSRCQRREQLQRLAQEPKTLEFQQVSRILL